MSDIKNSRRNFLKQSLLVTGAVAIGSTVSRIASAERKRGGGGAASGGAKEMPLVEPGKGAAVGVNYVHDKSKITKADLKTDRTGVKFADQYCSNCSLYKKHGTQGGSEVGTCAIFPNQVVKAGGWCTTWSKKS